FCSGIYFAGPFRSDGTDGKYPKGDVHGCASFFATTGMSCRKIPPVEWTRHTQCAGRVGRVCLTSHSAVEQALLLVTFSLHKQRKVTRSPSGSESPCSWPSLEKGLHLHHIRNTPNRVSGTGALR